VAYIGNEPVIGQWRKLDDISGSFNGSLTSFTTQVGGTNVTAGSANQLLVSLGGVLQEPGTDYSVSSSTITFTTAPAAALSFFAVLAGDALNTSVPADGSITTAKLGANLTVDLGLGSAGTPSLTFDADTGLFSGGDNQVNVSTSGVERAEFGASEVVFNDGGANYDFRVEGDTDANLLFVDASTDRVGVGTSSPAYALDVKQSNTGNSNTIAAKGGTNGGGYFWETNAGTTLGAVGYGDLISANSGSNNSAITTWGSQDLLLGTNRAERARIDSSGRLLVGTASSIGQDSQLQVAYTGSQVAEFFRFDSSENTAGAALHLTRSKSDTIGTNAAVNVDDGLGRIRFYGAVGSGTYLRGAEIDAAVESGTVSTSSLPTRLTFLTTADGASSPTERMRIASDGYSHFAGDGQGYTGTNYHTFDSNGTTQWTAGFFHNGSGANPYGVLIRYPNSNPGSAGNNQFLQCYGQATKLAEIRSNGGIANYTANDANLCDEREKKNIETLDSTWDCLKHWEVKKFHYIQEQDTDDKKYGVIAQQIAPHCPEVITDWVKQKAEDAVLDDDGNVVTEAKEEIVRMGVKEQQMMWMAIKALQEAQTRIETLEAEVAALKGA
jgi:hypothetical protein